ncbi:MAG: AMP-binding protein, partial [Ectothiorhodospiraceae bacterium]|nr:AMP-binding protein [Ectothiorhodospiraceae bacterium]
MYWPNHADGEIRRELRFGDRLVRCFVNRPPSVDAVFREAVAANPDGDALVWDGGRLSYAGLTESVDRIAANLAALGVGQGDRVALLVGNCPEFVQGAMAALRLGAIAVPVTIREQGEGLRYILGNCGARVLLFEAELAPRLPPLAELPDLEHVFCIGGAELGAQPFEVLLRERSDRPAPAEVREEDTAVILYTSGTTGRPKGAMLTH